MRLLINTATTFKGGSVQVAKSFIDECKNNPEHEYVVVLSRSLTNAIDTHNFPSNFSFYTIPYRPATRVISVKSPSEFFKKIFNIAQPDVVFTTSGPAYWKPPVPHIVGYNLGHYIYPESPFFKMISLYKRFRFKFREIVVFYYFKRDTDVFVVQTNDVNSRLRKKLNYKEVYTVSNTCSSVYFDPQNFKPKLPPRKENEFRFLTLSSYYIHKGFHVICDVIRKLISLKVVNIRFVLTLLEQDFISNFPDDVKPYIHNIGPVKIEECPSLYKECDAMFLPTLLECFSASYVEAMAMEKPILTSDLSFAHTVCKEAAIYFDPQNVSDVTNKILEIESNASLQEQMIGKGLERLSSFYGAEERARRYLDICKAQLDE